MISVGQLRRLISYSSQSSGVQFWFIAELSQGVVIPGSFAGFGVS